MRVGIDTPITPDNAFLPLVGETLLHRGLENIDVVTLHPGGESVDLSHMDSKLPLNVVPFGTGTFFSRYGG